MSVPTRRILDPIFGKPILRAANNGTVAWTKDNALSQWQKGTGWQAKLYGGAQTGNDDWAAVFIPTLELPVIDFNSAAWSYYMTAAQTMGVNIVIWIHDTNDLSKRAEVTQVGGSVAKATGWNTQAFTTATTGMFFYGEGTTGTALVAGTQYAWSQFQTDALFKNWTIYRISLEYGWEASGTFDYVWVAEVKFNGQSILIIPSESEITTQLGTLLSAGSALIGKVGIDQATSNANEVVVKASKTIQTELKAITAVAADVQSVSSTLDLSTGNIKKATIFIDHAKDNALASGGQGTEYVIQISEKASGNDTWRALTAFTAAITVPIACVTDAEEVAGQTVIEIGAVIPAVGDIIFFKNATIGSSEWSNIIALVSAAAASTFTIESALTNTQAQGTYYTQGEHFVAVLDVSAYTRLRVVCNNTKGTTNRAIVWRCAAITEA